MRKIFLIPMAVILSFFQFQNHISAEAGLPSTIRAGAGRLKNIADKGIITIGLQKDYYPFHSAEKNIKLPGIDIEIANILADALGVKLNLKFLPLQDLMKAVAAGEIDISFGGISSSLERSRMIAFSDPYIVTTPGGILSKRVLPPESESTDFLKQRIRGLGDIGKLGRLTVGVMKDTRNEDLLKEEEFKKHRIIAFTDRDKLLRALFSGEIDLLLGDGIYIQYLMRDNKIPASFIPVLSPYREENICLVLPRGDAELELYINFFIKTIKSDGRMQKIINRYL